MLCWCRQAVLTLLLLISGISVMGQDRSAGIISSPKGIGISIQFPAAFSDYEFTRFMLETDIYGMTFGRTSEPGVRLNYSRGFVFSRQTVEETYYSFYVAPGFSAGYVHDFEKSIIGGTAGKLQKASGFMAAISCTVGCCIHFPRHMELDISLETDAGMHIRQDRNISDFRLNIYKNGLIRTIYPQITIMRCF